MQAFLAFSRLIDRINQTIGKTAGWLVLGAVLVSSINATVRYSLNASSNAWLELQWYLFAAVFLLCSPYALLRNEHIRIDIISGRFSARLRAWIDICGTLLFLLPAAGLIMVLSWPVFMDSFTRDEVSADAGGLLRWPVKLLIPVAFFLLSLQGISEIIKRVAFLAGAAPEPAQKTAHGSPEGESHAA